MTKKTPKNKNLKNSNEKQKTTEQKLKNIFEKSYSAINSEVEKIYPTF